VVTAGCLGGAPKSPVFCGLAAKNALWKMKKSKLRNPGQGPLASLYIAWYTYRTNRNYFFHEKTLLLLLINMSKLVNIVEHGVKIWKKGGFILIITRPLP
jgi:hypothetical protein